MKAVGVRELKSRRQARAGLPNRPDRYPPPGPAAPPGSASRLLDEERGDR